MTDRQWRWTLGGISALAVALPFLLVTIPPSVDLPQHVAQVRLLHEALSHPEGPYRIQWLVPHSALTFLLTAIWTVATPLATGRIALIILGLLWVGSAHWLAARRGRPPEAATLASVLFFGVALRYGFCEFLLGWPLFIVWLDLTARPRTRLSPAEIAALSVLALMLYSAHLVWFAIASAWLGVSVLLFRPPARAVLGLVGTVLIPIALTLLWWTSKNEQALQLPPDWLASLWPRLDPRTFWEAVFGGLRGWVEPAMTAFLFIWCAWAVASHGRRFMTECDWPLLFAAALFALGTFTLPQYVSYFFYAWIRFADPMLFLLLLALPVPRLPRNLLRLASAGALVAFCAWTGARWREFEETSFTGLVDALAALPENPRVLGLNYLPASEVVRGRPYAHIVAYAQVLKGGQLGYSFAETPDALVVFRERDHRKWTADLEFHADRVKPADLQWFDYALVAASETGHTAVIAQFPLAPVTSTGQWRLYRVDHAAP